MSNSLPAQRGRDTTYAGIYSVTDSSSCFFSAAYRSFMLVVHAFVGSCRQTLPIMYAQLGLRLHLTAVPADSVCIPVPPVRVLAHHSHPDPRWCMCLLCCVPAFFGPMVGATAATSVSSCLITCGCHSAVRVSMDHQTAPFCCPPCVVRSVLGSSWTASLVLVRVPMARSASGTPVQMRLANDTCTSPAEQLLCLNCVKFCLVRDQIEKGRLFRI
jgi:hypothetical protein